MTVSQETSGTGLPSLSVQVMSPLSATWAVYCCAATAWESGYCPFVVLGSGSAVSADSVAGSVVGSTVGVGVVDAVVALGEAVELSLGGLTRLLSIR